ncbi:hypothetical protein CSV61_15330 [Sporosarcina sp. P3]|uniref:TRAP transporter small permease n=1 Tax=Sporosarcina sp. P3 TaxID=2048245 RepID=UPI000C165CF6|nr:TRAP transporter small permease [Sporosarcina sp. P3]PID20361.1 hypothetical protein CSV61_15330 [Sporosarcina sp. P3]
MQVLEMINQVTRDVGKYISGFAILAMMIVIVIDVFMRNVFGIPIAGTYEFVQYFLMPLSIFPALSFVYWVGVLPSLTELISKSPIWFKNFNKYLILCVDTGVFGLLTYYSFLFAMSGMADQMAVPIARSLIPVWPVYFLVPIAFLFVLLEVLTRFIRKTKEKEGDIGL